MKKLTATIILLSFFTIPVVFAMSENDSDTVVITLENNNKIVIYTRNKSDLREIEKYDINKMIRDLNRKVNRTSADYLELDDDEGDSYIRDTTIIYQDGDKYARIKLGDIEFGVDTEDIDNWDDFEDEWRRDDDFRSYSYIDRNVDRTDNTFNFELGTNNWLIDGTDFPNETNEPFSVRPWGSWYVGLSNINKTWVGGPLFVEWGFGVSWYNWKFEDDAVQALEGADSVEFITQFAPDINPEKSKLSATYLNFSVVPIFDLAQGRRKVNALERGSFRVKRSRKQGLRFGVGGYAGYRLGSRSKFVYKDAGNKEKDINRDNFYLTNFRYGIRAQMGYKGVDFFANYDLNEVFAQGKGPKLNAISFGIIF